MILIDKILQLHMETLLRPAVHFCFRQQTYNRFCKREMGVLLNCDLGSLLMMSVYNLLMIKNYWKTLLRSKTSSLQLYFYTSLWSPWVAEEAVMSDHGQWCVSTDGSYYAGERLTGLEYHQKLNLLFVTSKQSGVLVYDSTSSTLLKTSKISGLLLLLHAFLLSAAMQLLYYYDYVSTI